MKLWSASPFYLTALCAVLLLGLTSCLPQASKHRGQILKELANIELQFNHDPNNDKIRQAYADVLFKVGRFQEAKDALIPLHAKPNPDTAVELRMAELLYLLGQYQDIESILKNVSANNPKNPQLRLQVQIYLAFLYYQTNQFSKSQELFKDFKNMKGEIKLPLLDLMQSFGQTKPYEIEWQTPGEKTTEIEFTRTDPLPLIPVSLQGREIYALIDTGGDAFILDPSLAAELKIHPVAEEKTAFGGGKKNNIGFAQAETLKLGKVLLKHVPIQILPVRQTSAMYADKSLQVGGIVGTSVLRQFLPTIDYRNHKLILREALPETTKAFYAHLNQQTTVVMPFALWATHLLLAQGKINDVGPMTFFVDSGLASSKQAFIAPKQTLEYLGIPKPKRKKSNTVGGGGGAWESAEFMVSSLSLGPLRQEQVFGEYGGLVPSTYWDNGFIQDGLISHRFLKAYTWTIDFMGRKLIFEKK